MKIKLSKFDLRNMIFVIVCLPWVDEKIDDIFELSRVLLWHLIGA